MLPTRYIPDRLCQGLATGSLKPLGAEPKKQSPLCKSTEEEGLIHTEGGSAEVHSIGYKPLATPDQKGLSTKHPTLIQVNLMYCNSKPCVNLVYIMLVSQYLLHSLPCLSVREPISYLFVISREMAAMQQSCPFNYIYYIMMAKEER